MESKVLIMEGGPDGVFLKHMLERGEYTVSEAKSGNGYLEKLKREKPGIILVDLGIPEIQRMDMFKALRHGKPNGSAVVITTHDSMRSAAEAVLQGNGTHTPELPLWEAPETGTMEMQRNLRYKMGAGDLYLVEEKKLDTGADVFLDLLSSGYSGMIISRSRPEKIRELCKIEVPLLWLSEDVSDKGAVYPELHFLEKIITDYATRDKVVLLDRLDYLIVKTSFKEVLGFIQRLNELFYREGGVLIISMDPDTISAQEHSLLKKETNEVKLRAEPNLPEDLWEILGFVSQQNILGKKPSQKEIVKQFNVTRTTARKRINRLGSMELVMGSKKGRYKVLELTEKGITFWKSRS